MRFLSNSSWRQVASYTSTHLSKIPQSTDANMIVVDLRTDTITKPTAAMRKAIAEAVVGDDVKKEDPTVNALERRCAELFGMEAALFVPTGTMGNLVSIMAHCDSRMSEIIVGSNSHVHLYENGSYAHIAGVACFSIVPEKDGTLDLGQIEAAIRPDELHQPNTRLLCLENTHRMCGGRILPVEYHAKVRELTKKHGVKIHLDGARLMNACVGLNVSPSAILKNVDSVSMCFSKGLGCPVGSVIGGSRAFINRALRLRKALGGGMRQSGILAAAALHVLDSPFEDMIRRDHENAKKLARAITALGSKFLSADVAIVQTNIVFVHTGTVSARKIMDMLAEKGKSGVSVLTGAHSENVFSFITHRDVSDEDIDRVVEKLATIVETLG